MFVGCLALLWISTLGQTTPAAAAPRAVRTDAPAKAAAKPAERTLARHQFVTFGHQILERSTVIATVDARSQFEMGQGVAVVRLDVEEELKGDTHLKEIVALAAPGDVAVGSKYVVFLEPFGNGGRFKVVNRFAASERDFDDKIKVLKQYLEVLAIADVGEQLDALRDRLLLNVSSDRVFVKWNGIEELRAFVKNNAQRFAAPHRARLVAAWRGEASATYREELKKVLQDLGVPLNEERRG